MVKAVCACMGMRERKRKRERGGGGEIERESPIEAGKTYQILHNRRDNPIYLKLDGLPGFARIPK